MTQVVSQVGVSGRRQTDSLTAILHTDSHTDAVTTAAVSSCVPVCESTSESTHDAALSHHSQSRPTHLTTDWAPAQLLGLTGCGSVLRF